MKCFMRSALVLVVTVALLSSCDSSSNSAKDDAPSPRDTSDTSDAPITLGSLSYGGQMYKTVVIGTQTWMAENLEYKVDSSWEYENSAVNGAKHGRLYTWAAAMKLPDSCNKVSCSYAIQTRHQGICPSGWHIPSDSEWAILSLCVGGDSIAGFKLKSRTGWANSGNGSDAYGFGAVPAGFRNINSEHVGKGGLAYFWSSTEYEKRYAPSRGLFSSDDLLHFYWDDKSWGYSVRCLKD